jgi:hypothetical protein
LILTFPFAMIAPLEVRAEHETAPNDPVPLLEMVLKFVFPEHEMLLNDPVPLQATFPNDPVPLLEMVLKFVFPEHEMLLNDPVPLQATFPNDPVPVQATADAPTGPKLPVPVDDILAQVIAPLLSALNGKLLPLYTLNPPPFVARNPLLFAVTAVEFTVFA